ncbi:MAG: hypothetical protein MHPSP_002914, partial [Paramarteilia canceri]
FIDKAIFKRCKNNIDILRFDVTALDQKKQTRRGVTLMKQISEKTGKPLSELYNGLYILDFTDLDNVKMRLMMTYDETVDFNENKDLEKWVEDHPIDKFL